VEVERGTSCERFGLDFHHGNLSSFQLLLATQLGDRAAFLELIHTYDAMVMRVALTLTSSEGAAQEIYCRVFRDAFASANTLGTRSSVFIWLYRILVRHCLEYCRLS
jgi:RNA polymerase sigma-70 factor, ECF subfamily